MDTPSIRPAVLEHCREIDRCNQRGGRMLSIADLLEAGTLTPPLAAYCLAAIGGGASFMVGAMPGGAGKTTVMGAMLNFVPKDVPLVAADSQQTVAAALRSTDARRCFICHEIGAGPYYAYLWGEPLRQYFRLRQAGHMLATNLHADTFEQAREQICGANAVDESLLRGMNLAIFLSVGRRGVGRRCVEEVWESDGQSPHRKVYDRSADADGIAPAAMVTPEAISAARETIDRLTAAGARTIEAVRSAIVS